MDAGGNIYELTPEEMKEPQSPEVKEDQARLFGFLKERAQRDKEKHLKLVAKRGILVWDPRRQGTYRKRPKEIQVGIDGIQELTGSDVQDISEVLGQNDPGDEQPEPVSPEDEDMPEPDEAA